MAGETDTGTMSDEQLAGVIAGRGETDEGWKLAREAFSQLYVRHARKLLGFLSARVHRNDLEDIHQAIWERVWNHLPTGFHGGNFRAWLHQIARNYIIDHSRKKRADELAEDYDVADSRVGRPDEAVVEQERRAALSRCLERLAESARLLVNARLGGESYDEICPRMGLKMAQAHKLFHQAKEQLRRCVETESGQ
jgi:RNA polymerase sigma factor (sigma-70 family)